MAIKLLIVDDSALMRKHLSQLFLAEGDFEVILARTGKEAVDQLMAVQPDVVTLDINMPEMDGLTALSLIMTQRPTPVVMVSSLTEKGAMATFEALALGAVDYVAKPGGTISLSIDDVGEELIRKVRAAARSKPPIGRLNLRAKLQEENARTLAQKPPVARHRTSGLVIIGVSTGGPRALEEILPLLGADFPWPILIAQHMPATFTDAFARRMNSLCALNVTEVRAPIPIQPGNIYIGRGDTDMVVSERAGQLIVLARPINPDFTWHPSVELLVQSALKHTHARNIIGVQLTGMGDDGAAAMAELHKQGGRTIAESEETAVVFGMPMELIRRNGATVTLPVHQIAGQLKKWLY